MKGESACLGLVQQPARRDGHLAEQLGMQEQALLQLELHVMGFLQTAGLHLSR